MNENRRRKSVANEYMLVGLGELHKLNSTNCKSIQCWAQPATATTAAAATTIRMHQSTIHRVNTAVAAINPLHVAVNDAFIVNKR